MSDRLTSLNQLSKKNIVVDLLIYFAKKKLQLESILQMTNQNFKKKNWWVVFCTEKDTIEVEVKILKCTDI